MLKNKYDVSFFIQVKNANPNGDPDFGNLPRIDEEDMHGIITDVAIKRKIRDYIQNAFYEVDGMDIIMKTATNMNHSIAKCAQEANNGKIPKKGENKKVNETRNVACNKFYDVRTFGAVLSTGANAGQVQGPIQIEMAKSIDPIYQKDICITRLCYTEKEFGTLEEFENLDESKSEDEKRTMGRKQYVPYGLYRVNLYVSPNYANKTGFDEKDLNVLFEAILNMYNSSRSSSKSSMNVVGPLFIFKHVGNSDSNNEQQIERECLLGCAPAYMLQDSISISKKEDIEYARDYKDYNIVINLRDLPKGIRVGFKYLPFNEIVWDKPTDNWVKIIE